MAYQSLPDFESFWDFANHRSLTRNDLSYHPCCDFWSTRGSKASKTHKTAIKWKTLLAKIDPEALDSKAALNAIMVEHEWNMPVLLNRGCVARRSRFLDLRVARRHRPQHERPLLVSPEDEGQANLPLFVFSDDEDQANPSDTDNTSNLYLPSPRQPAHSLLTPGL